ncbi:hypothetical protein AB0C77_13810 [Streptomyces sp. NPDC048629]|uniref:hypothetical protein n=1 Tax=Streptomyces sp. NPDC048629 TaxID=3154824 RepID=UPI00343B35A2
MGTPIISQDFESTLSSVTEMRNALTDGETSVGTAINRIDALSWTGQSRQAFNGVLELWTQAVRAEFQRFSEYTDTTQTVVESQRRGEEDRKQQATAITPDAAAQRPSVQRPA